jgi:hypothetical protein
MPIGRRPIPRRDVSEADRARNLAPAVVVDRDGDGHGD